MTKLYAHQSELIMLVKTLPLGYTIWPKPQDVFLFDYLPEEEIQTLRKHISIYDGPVGGYATARASAVIELVTSAPRAIRVTSAVGPCGVARDIYPLHTLDGDVTKIVNMLRRDNEWWVRTQDEVLTLEDYWEKQA